MAYDTDWPLRDEFEALIKPWLVKHQLTHYDWQQMHWLLDGLRYLKTVKREYPKIKDKPLLPGHVECVTCGRSSAESDACVLNFAGNSQIVPQWYCRDHYPKLQGLMPAGWMPPAAEQSRRAQATMTAWHKLEPEERSLINRNVVTVASSGEP